MTADIFKQNFYSSDQELLELVDENNNPLGVFKTRFEIHHSNPISWHRVSSIWVINKNGQILCQKQSPNKVESKNVLDKWFPFFGGHIVKDMDSLASALKELSEEIGIEVGENELKFIEVRKSLSAHHHYIYAYILNWNGNIKDLKFNDGEISAVKWMNFDEVENIIKNDSTRSPLSQKIKDYFAKKLYK